MNNTQFKKGDRVRIVNDWIGPYAKKYTAVVDNFEKHGMMEFVKVRWTGKAAEQKFSEKFGVLFPIDELRKI